MAIRVPQHERHIGLHLGHNLGQEAFRFGVHPVVHRSVFQETHFDSALLCEPNAGLAQQRLAADHRRPVSVVANNCQHDNAVVFAYRLQQNPGNSKNAVIVMRADGKEGFGHEWREKSEWSRVGRVPAGGKPVAWHRQVRARCDRRPYSNWPAHHYEDPPRSLLVAVVTITAGARAEAPEITALLQHPIIDPKLPLAEVQAYTEARVPLVPPVKSLAEWETFAAQTRRDVLDKVVFRGETAKQWRDAKAKVEWLDTIEGGPGYHIKKLRYEALPGLWIPALLYEPDKIDGQDARAPRRQRPRPQRQSRALQADPLHQSREAWHRSASTSNGSAWGSSARGLRALADEPARPLRRERSRAVLSRDVARARHPARRCRTPMPRASP